MKKAARNAGVGTRRRRESTRKQKEGEQEQEEQATDACDAHAGRGGGAVPRFRGRRQTPGSSNMRTLSTRPPVAGAWGSTRRCIGQYQTACAKCTPSCTRQYRTACAQELDLACA
eukprot:2127203-Rhodomonas_salina.3